MIALTMQQSLLQRQDNNQPSDSLYYIKVKKYINCRPTLHSPDLASPGLDRLLDRAEVVITHGPSFREQGRKNIFEELQPDAQAR